MKNSSCISSVDTSGSDLIITSDNLLMAQYRYHPTGCDYNGNFGPSPEDEGWLSVEGTNYDDAVAKLPLIEQEKVKRSVEAYYEDAPQDTYEGDVVGTFLSDSCGWGVGFSLYNEENWQAFLDEC